MKPLEIHFKADSRGRKLSLQAIPMAELATMVGDLLCLAHHSRASSEPFEVQMVEGSIGFQVISLSLGVAMSQLIVEAQEKPAPVKVRAVLEKWNRNKFEVCLSGADLSQELVLREMKFASEKAVTQPVTKILQGEVRDAGGATANFHLVTAEDEVLLIKAERDDLKRLQENIIYQDVMIKVRADYAPHDHSLSNYRLLEFISLKPRRPNLSNFQKQGAKAWSGIDAVQWVRENRGGAE